MTSEIARLIASKILSSMNMAGISSVRCLCLAFSSLIISSSLIDGATGSADGTKWSSYHGYKVIRTEPVPGVNFNFEDREILLNKLDASDDHTKNVSIWKNSMATANIDLMVAPDHFKIVASVLDEHNMPWRVMIPDVHERVKRQAESPMYSDEQQQYSSTDEDNFLPDSFRLDEYHTVKEIYAWMEAMAKKHPTMMRTKDIGLSFEKRPLKIIIVDPGKAARKIWIDGGIHAREWASIGVATHFIDSLIYKYEEYKDVIDRYQWHIMPVMNVDGYAYAKSTDRLWRKTRSMTDSVFGCRGVDANRNWNFRWRLGAKKDPCSGLYAGQYPESEKCVQAVGKYVKTMSSMGNVVAFITLHSYGQLWMSPWGYASLYPPNYENLLAPVTNRKISPASGSSDDWAFAVANIPFVYTVELRDTGEHGFLLPPDQIKPTGEEIFSGILAAAEEISNILDGDLLGPAKSNSSAENMDDPQEYD
ncbi:unnamed protein product [Notodromas monacha]|uniref:Peptidase M14 domain-containing protein n=1 Tax=Notodromas monacha TaxID=399045 RepID=A0A7R9BH24_9CRUS|nr:unnamed protein product [Notodromas monacha]CAG0914515.1 unnamed protein product [Notodromas monacha]